MIPRMLTAVSIFLMTTAPAWAFQPPTGQSEFVPVKDLPPAETMPAAPLVVAAYAIIWFAMMIYLWTIWRRLNKVESDMQALAQKTRR